VFENFLADKKRIFFFTVNQLKSSNSGSLTPQRPIAIKPSPEQHGYVSAYNTGLNALKFVQPTSSAKLSPSKQPPTKTRRVAADSSHHEHVTSVFL
jgi:hypothetical protein